MNRTKKMLIAGALCAAVAAAGSPAGAFGHGTQDGVAFVSAGQAGSVVLGSEGRIVFIRTDALGDNLAYAANPDGSHERLLLPGEAGWAHWSPDGRAVDVRHSDLLAATIVDAETGASRDLQIPDPVFDVHAHHDAGAMC